MKTPLTPRLCAELPAPPKGRTYFADAALHGLSLCVTANGARTFYRVGRIAGRPCYLRIGGFPALGLPDARKAAKRLNARIAMGERPDLDKRQARQATTMGDLWAFWAARYGKPARKSFPRDERRYGAFLSVWRGRALAEVTMTDVEDLRDKIARDNGQVTANRVIQLLATMYRKSPRIGYLGPNPCDGVRRFPEQERERFLEPQELQPFFEALAAESIDWQDLFLLALLSGARRENLLAARWDEFRLADAVWRLPMTKNGQPVILHLPPKAVEMLERRAAAKTGGVDWVFPAATKSGHLASPTRVWQRVTERAGLKNLRFHDARRTLGSHQNILGASLQIIGKSLGHTSLAATAIYARLPQQPVKDSVNAAADAILAAGGVE